MTIRTHKYVNKVCGSILQYVVVFQTKTEMLVERVLSAYPNCPGETKTPKCKKWKYLFHFGLILGTRKLDFRCPFHII